MHMATGASGEVGISCLRISSHLFLFGRPVASSRYTFFCSARFCAAVRMARASSMAMSAISPAITANTTFSSWLSAVAFSCEYSSASFVVVSQMSKNSSLFAMMSVFS